MRYKATFRHVEGYSAVDHVGPELALYSREECAAKTWATKTGAIQGGQRCVRRVEKRLKKGSAGVWKHSLPRIRVEAVRG